MKLTFQNKKEEAKYYSDASTLERDKQNFSRDGAIQFLNVLPKNYDLYYLGKKGIEYLKVLSKQYGTWADLKSNHDLKTLKEKLKLTETDLKEVWRDERNALNNKNRRERKDEVESNKNIFSRRGQIEKL